MAKKSTKKIAKRAKVKTTPKEIEIELEPGMWEKFEALIRRAAKMGHKPHETGKAKKRRA